MLKYLFKLTAKLVSISDDIYSFKVLESFKILAKSSKYFALSVLELFNNFKCISIFSISNIGGFPFLKSKIEASVVSASIFLTSFSTFDGISDLAISFPPYVIAKVSNIFLILLNSNFSKYLVFI